MTINEAGNEPPELLAAFNLVDAVQIADHRLKMFRPSALRKAGFYLCAVTHYR